MRIVLLNCLLLALATEALAHRLDEYLQATRVSVTTKRLDISIDLTPGVAIADQALSVIDKDRDGRISKTERAAYVQLLLKDIRVAVDAKVITLRVVESTFPNRLEMKGGVGVIRIKATAPVGPLAAGRHSLNLTNAHLPVISVYLVNALAPKDPAIQITTQTRNELQSVYYLEFSVNPTSP